LHCQSYYEGNYNRTVIAPAFCHRQLFAAGNADQVDLESEKIVEQAVKVGDLDTAEKQSRIRLDSFKGENSINHAAAVKQHAAFLRLLHQISNANKETRLSLDMLKRIEKQRETSAPEYSADVNGPCCYMSELQRKIKRAWYPPREKESRKVKVLFRIDRLGELSDLRIKSYRENFPDIYREKSHSACSKELPRMK
jgi:hypothetical protein